MLVLHRRSSSRALKGVARAGTARAGWAAALAVSMSTPAIGCASAPPPLPVPLKDAATCKPRDAARELWGNWPALNGSQGAAVSAVRTLVDRLPAARSRASRPTCAPRGGGRRASCSCHQTERWKQLTEPIDAAPDSHIGKCELAEFRRWMPVTTRYLFHR